MVNSGPFDGLRPIPDGFRAIVEALEKEGRGEFAVSYRIRDWLVSRQRYWGTPIPVIYCDTDGIVPVPYEDLPVRLPEEVDFKGSGESPLKTDRTFIDVACPRCGRPARRETDTMDTFVDSGWYWFRYLSPHNDDDPVDRELVDRWTPVDQYTGGAEHAVMHLLYARFFTKALADLGIVGQREPFKRLFNQGQILGADGERMSKSRGNVQDPDDLVRRYGADTIRLFLMFMGPWDQGGPWSPTGIGGVHRFLNRVWTLALDPHGAEPGDPERGGCRQVRMARPPGRRSGWPPIGRCGSSPRSTKGFRFNTMVAHLMELANTLFRYRGTEVAGGDAWNEAIRLTLLMLAPAAPHISEELWSRVVVATGTWSSIHSQAWPTVDASAIVDETREIPIQINGKVRDKVTVPIGIDQAELERVVLARDRVREPCWPVGPRRG